eukprot:3231601-Rhodomonas_salina.1
MEAVAHLHSMGIAHRDLKPENVLMKAADRKSPQYNVMRPPDSLLLMLVSGVCRVYACTHLHAQLHLCAQHQRCDGSASRVLSRAVNLPVRVSHVPGARTRPPVRPNPHSLTTCPTRTRTRSLHSLKHAETDPTLAHDASLGADAACLARSISGQLVKLADFGLSTIKADDYNDTMVWLPRPLSSAQTPPPLSLLSLSVTVSPLSPLYLSLALSLGYHRIPKPQPDIGEGGRAWRGLGV